MMSEKFDLEREQKQLVLARLSALNPESKLSLGNNNEISVKEMIESVKKEDEMGKKIVKVQMRMLKVLSGAA
ncbi:MAG: hypothetical protein Q8O89_00940 [Nanoarchaeota archaeon]|nr:hypothetical protein [Nanoarchaeota archaeon]